jgi:hypothetical protein
VISKVQHHFLAERSGEGEILTLPPLEAMRAATRRSRFSEDFQSVGMMVDGCGC